MWMYINGFVVLFVFSDLLIGSVLIFVVFVFLVLFVMGYLIFIVFFFGVFNLVVVIFDCYVFVLKVL